MNKVKIICDSTIDFTSEMYKKYDIDVAPLHVAFKDDPKDYRDGVDINSEALYKKVEEIKETPKTGAVNVAEWMDIYKGYIDNGYDILVITIGSDLSSCYQNAVVASQEYDEGRIFVLDGKSLSTGSGLLLMKMIKYRDEGLSAKEIYEKVLPLVDKVSAKFCLDTLDYLNKGGRCSSLKLLVATALHIHPVLKMIGGKLVVYKKTRGLYSKAMDEQINELIADLPNIDTDCVFVTHSGRDDENAKYIIDKIKEYIPLENIHETKAGCTVSSHCGPKTIGILYLMK